MTDTPVAHALAELDAVKDTMSVKRVFGDPYEVNGTTIIPVATVRGGGGGGGGEGTAPDKQGTGSGAGMGFGVHDRPVGVYILKNGTTTWSPTPKTKRSVRTVPLPTFAVERLRSHKVDQARRRLALGEHWHDNDLVCDRGDGRPLDPMSFSHGFARIADEAGLDDVRLHDLRHGVGTEHARKGTPLAVTSYLLGHTSTAFTAQTYQHADEEMIESAAQSLEESFGA